MEWQNRRPARAARLAPLTLALAALALAGFLTGRLGGAPAHAQSQDFTGQWLVEYRTDEGKTSLTLRHRSTRRDASGGQHISDWNTTRNVSPESLRGLSAEQANSASGANVRFEIRRDAGTFVCEGWFRQGKGSGHFNFVPDPGFASELSRRGVGTPDARQLFALASADVGLDLLDELKTQGYGTPTVEQFARMGDHGVRADYVRGLGAAGYRLGSIDELVRMRDHGVTLGYINELRAAGFHGLDAKDLVRARDHGVTAAFVREIQAAGYRTDSLGGLVRIRDHGVTASFIRGLRAEGYDALAIEQLVRLRDHGVTPDFIRTAKSRASTAPTPEELIRLRNRGSY